MKLEERELCLKNWFEVYKENLFEMSWFEFLVCVGFIFGIFCFVVYVFYDELYDEDIVKIR